MILKTQNYDEQRRIVTSWLPNVRYAVKEWSEEFETDVLKVFIGKDQTEPNHIVLHDNCGVYLCNDEGKTIEVLSRLRDPART